MRAFFSLFTAFWSLSVVLSDPSTCPEVIDKVQDGVLDIEADLSSLQQSDAECWTKVISILLDKYKNDEDWISQLELKPKISQAPQQEIKYNSLVNLTCTMAVSPNRTLGPIRWVKVVDKSPKVIINGKDVVIVSKKPSGKESSGKLQLAVTEEWIGAEILCGVEYRVQSFDSVMRWSDPHRLNVSLTITEGPHSVEVRTDEDPTDHRMTCKFAGSLIPMDNPWKKGEEAVSSVKGSLETRRVPQSGTVGVVTWTLEFLRVSNDSKYFGNYSCGLDNVKSQNASLKLAEPAKLMHFELGNIKSDDNDKTVFLKCIASGVPRPTITWYNCRSKETVEADEEAPDKDGNYVSKKILKNGEDAGDYSCAVKNDYLDEPIQHSFAAPTATTTAAEEADEGSTGITIVVLPEVAMVVAFVVLFAVGVCIARKRHKLLECLRGERVTRVVKRTAQLRRGHKPRSMGAWARLVE